MAKKIFLLFLLFYFFSLTDLTLYINFQSINLNESLNRKNDYLSALLTDNIYFNISIGSEKEKIKAIIKMDETGFYIYNTTYNYEKSGSFKYNSTLKKFYSINEKKGFIANDSMFINNMSIKNNKINNCELKQSSFALINNENKSNNFAVVGLNQYERYEEKNTPLFLKQPKKNKFTNSYTFSFLFTNSNNGYFILDENLDDNDKNNMKYTKSRAMYVKLYWSIKFNKVSLQHNNDTSIIKKYPKILETKDAELVVNLPYIQGTYEYKLFIYHAFFSKLISKNVCEFKNVTINNTYGTYICDKKSDIFKEAYNNKFPNLTFYHNELNKTFILTKKDLFIENNENKEDKYVYFLVFFSTEKFYVNPYAPKFSNIPRWKLGIPFFKKYRLHFDEDIKTVGYYEDYSSINEISEEKNFENKRKNSILIKVIISIILLIIVFILGILFHRSLVKIPRKKQANELDDEFEYNAIDKKSQNLIMKKNAKKNNYNINEDNSRNNIILELSQKNSS